MVSEMRTTSPNPLIVKIRVGGWVSENTTLVDTDESTDALSTSVDTDVGSASFILHKCSFALVIGRNVRVLV